MANFWSSRQEDIDAHLQSPDPHTRRFFGTKVAMRSLQDATTSGDYDPCVGCGGTSSVATRSGVAHCAACSGTGRTARPGSG